MIDLVERLRGYAEANRDDGFHAEAAVADEAADEIERLRGVEQDAVEWVEERTKRLRAEVERLRAALKPFATSSDSYDDEPPARVIASQRGCILSVYDLRAAKAELG